MRHALTCLWIVNFFGCSVLGSTELGSQSAGQDLATLCSQAANDEIDRLAVLTDFGSALALPSGLVDTLWINSLPYGDIGAGMWKATDVAVKWFDEARVEYHPEHAQNQDTYAYRAQLGRLGAEHLVLLMNGDAVVTELTAFYSKEHLKADVSDPTEATYGSVLTQCDTNDANYAPNYATGSADANGLPVAVDEPFGFKIHRSFLDQWNAGAIDFYQRGGTPTFEDRLFRWGFPMSPRCKLASDPQGPWVQYFERARFETNDGVNVRIAMLGQSVHDGLKHQGVLNERQCETSGAGPVLEPVTLPAPQAATCAGIAVGSLSDHEGCVVGVLTEVDLSGDDPIVNIQHGDFKNTAGQMIMSKMCRGMVFGLATDTTSALKAVLPSLKGKPVQFVARESNGDYRIVAITDASAIAPNGAPECSS